MRFSFQLQFKNFFTYLYDGLPYCKMELQFGAIRRDELKEAAQLSARAYDDYVYVTNYFPDDEERRMGSWSLKKAP